MYVIDQEVSTALRDFRVKLIELTVFSIGSFSLVLYSVQNKEIRFVLASFALLIVFETLLIIFGANSVKQKRQLKKGELNEDVEITHFSYQLTKADFVALTWYAVTLLMSFILLIGLNIG